MNIRKETWKITKEEMVMLRQEATALADRLDVSFVLEAIEFYRSNLPSQKLLFEYVEFCGRAITDVRHEIAMAQYGVGSEQEENAYLAMHSFDREVSAIRAGFSSETISTAFAKAVKAKPEVLRQREKVRSGQPHAVVLIYLPAYGGRFQMP